MRLPEVIAERHEKTGPALFVVDLISFEHLRLDYYLLLVSGRKQAF